MAASSADFQWYNDVDDEHPIGQSPPPTNTSTANTSPSVTSSAVPSDRVRQLRGQSKLAINVVNAGRIPARAVAKPKGKTSRKRRRSSSGKGSNQKVKKTVAHGKAKAISLDSEPNTDDAISVIYSSSSDDDSDVSNKDISVSHCILDSNQLSGTDTIYYRNARAATVSVAKTSAVLTSILCIRRGNAREVANCSRGGGVSSASTCLISFPQCMLIVLYRKNRDLPAGSGFYKSSNSTSTLRAHFTREGGDHYKYYREICEKNNVMAIAKSPDPAKEGDTLSVQSNISSFLVPSSTVREWHRDGLLSHICQWIILDNQVRVSLYIMSTLHAHI